MNRIQISLLGRALVAPLAVVAMSSAHAVSTVQVVGPAGPLAVDQLFTVDLSGHDFVAVNGGGLNISFTAGLLELLSVHVDPSWNFFSQPGTIDNASGTLSELAFNVWGWPSGHFPIASLQFQAKAPGAAIISLAESPNWPFATPNWDTPAVDYGSYNVTIAGPVPEPAAWLLMLGGLGLVGARAARRLA
ncbi:MAG: PEP-CTERM sorting domain-containing protein [Burkholderiaceae bacterium]|nr:PEP-CTERM sorting domain-containing protein [Burkholderiaceae bacterium]